MDIKLKPTEHNELKKVDKIKIVSKNKKFNNELVVQHNNLIEARYRLSLQEKRLLLFIISKIEPNDDSFRKISISIYELANLIGLEGNSVYKEVDKVAKSLMERSITIKNIDTDSILRLPLLASSEYFCKKGIIEIVISERLAPYLLQLKGEFTVIRLSDIMKLKSIYAIRIYELLKQYECIGSRKINISDLRLFCGISNEKLRSIANLRIKVIEIAKREINEKSDIIIDFEFIKRSREFIAVEFSIKKNPNYGKTNEEIEMENKIKRISSELRTRDKIIDEIVYHFGFTTSKAALIIEHLSDDEAEQALKSVKNQIEKGQAKNPKAMLRIAFKEKWKPDVFNPDKIKQVS